jgi:ethanolamine ammonia-lyase large subunit
MTGGLITLILQLMTESGEESDDGRNPGVMLLVTVAAIVFIMGRYRGDSLFFDYWATERKSRSTRIEIRLW